jgi:hypothetical protein
MKTLTKAFLAILPVLFATGCRNLPLEPADITVDDPSAVEYENPARQAFASGDLHKTINGIKYVITLCEGNYIAGVVNSDGSIAWGPTMSFPNKNIDGYLNPSITINTNGYVMVSYSNISKNEIWYHLGQMSTDKTVKWISTGRLFELSAQVSSIDLNRFNEFVCLATNNFGNVFYSTGWINNGTIVWKKKDILALQSITPLNFPRISIGNLYENAILIGFNQSSKSSSTIFTSARLMYNTDYSIKFFENVIKFDGNAKYGDVDISRTGAFAMVGCNTNTSGEEIVFMSGKLNSNFSTTGGVTITQGRTVSRKATDKSGADYTFFPPHVAIDDDAQSFYSFHGELVDMYFNRHSIDANFMAHKINSSSGLFERVSLKSFSWYFSNLDMTF